MRFTYSIRNIPIQSMQYGALFNLSLFQEEIKAIDLTFDLKTRLHGNLYSQQLVAPLVSNEKAKNHVFSLITNVKEWKYYPVEVIWQLVDEKAR